MIDRRYSVFFIPIIFLFALLMSCQSNKTALQVSEHFWLGMQAKNVALVKKYSLVNSIDKDEDISEYEKISNISFGKIIIDGNVTEIETTVTTFLNKKKVDINLKTYLEKHNEIWKVNYRKTVFPLAFNQDMKKIYSDVEEITEEITGQIEKSVEGIKEKVVPEIKSEIEQAEKELLEKIPELKNVFEEFLQELEKSLEELLPEEKEDEVITHET